MPESRAVAMGGRRIDQYALADILVQTMNLHDGQVLDIALNRDGVETRARLSAIAIPHDCTRQATLGSSPGEFVELLGALVAAIPDNETDAYHGPGVLVTARVATQRFTVTRTRSGSGTVNG